MGSFSITAQLSSVHLLHQFSPTLHLARALSSALLSSAHHAQQALDMLVIFLGSFLLVGTCCWNGLRICLYFIKTLCIWLCHCKLGISAYILDEYQSSSRTMRISTVALHLIVFVPMNV